MNEQHSPSHLVEQDYQTLEHDMNDAPDNYLRNLHPAARWLVEERAGSVYVIEGMVVATDQRIMVWQHHEPGLHGRHPSPPESWGLGARIREVLCQTPRVMLPLVDVPPPDQMKPCPECEGLDEELSACHCSWCDGAGQVPAAEGLVVYHRGLAVDAVTVSVVQAHDGCMFPRDDGTVLLWFPPLPSAAGLVASCQPRPGPPPEGTTYYYAPGVEPHQRT